MLSLPVDPLMTLFGVTYSKVQEGLIEAVFEVSNQISQPFGLLHGGASLAIAESVAGMGSIYLCEEDQNVVGAQISANHISSARIGDQLLARGTLLHRGRLTHVWNVDIIRPATHKLISTIRVTNQIIGV